MAVILSAATNFWQHFALAAEPLSTNGQALQAKYSTLIPRLAKNQFGIPLYLESTEESNSLHVDIYGIFAYPFAQVRDALKKPDNWCDINILLFNIKAATFSKASSQWLLTLYSGRKYYQLPQDAFKLDLNFHIAAAQEEYLNIELSGENGPLGTRDHRIKFEATPLEKDRTFIHFRYDYSFGILARAAMASYYTTIGHDKKGFSVSATDKKGDPVYINGARGSLERTAIRSYFAIQAYMEALDIPDNQQFEKRLNHWYDLTSQFPQQLYEMDKGDYLANKRREHHNQLILQEKLAN
ncbi:MAG: hypothetical protein EHM86_08050 [Desulfobulbaceae bacterium]|nr:MAG: hypothetical protein EHM86_08050 [Desulfobulbaceae bacterium]